MGKLYWMAVFLLVLAAGGARAQDRTVSGTVTGGDDGSTLVGVNILEKGTTNGTVTDASGNYSMTVKDDATLVFSFIGYAPQEIAVGNRTAISVILQPDVATLNEVVVVGYGTVKKSDATGALAVVDSRAFNKGVVNSPRSCWPVRLPVFRLPPTAVLPVIHLRSASVAGRR